MRPGVKWALGVTWLCRELKKQVGLVPTSMLCLSSFFFYLFFIFHCLMREISWMRIIRSFFKHQGIVGFMIRGTLHPKVGISLCSVSGADKSDLEFFFRNVMNSQCPNFPFLYFYVQSSHKIVHKSPSGLLGNIEIRSVCDFIEVIKGKNR